ncbi:hypothetical protein K1719_028282 [Acacia pycnantha]|nr:hypothetical protein K1719_028282 [Acacia pycnantha]
MENLKKHLGKRRKGEFGRDVKDKLNLGIATQRKTHETRRWQARPMKELDDDPRDLKRLYIYYLGKTNRVEREKAEQQENRTIGKVLFVRVAES